MASRSNTPLVPLPPSWQYNTTLSKTHREGGEQERETEKKKTGTRLVDTDAMSSTPATPTNGLGPRGVPGFEPLVCVVDFHHARGPEVEKWFGADDRDPAAEYDWTLLPFMALSDGAHA